MIEYVPHNKLDAEAWDARLHRTANASWYGTYAALEAASPGWDALVDRDKGIQMPLTWRRKMGIRYLFQPLMLQHLGPYAPQPSPQCAGRFLEEASKHFRYADINLATLAVPKMGHIWCEERRSHVLELDGSIKSLRKGYSTNHQRNLKKAVKQGVAVEQVGDPQQVIAFIEGADQYAAWRLRPAQQATLRRVVLATAADGTGFGRLARQAGQVVAAGWFAHGPQDVVFLKGVSSTQGRAVGAMHALIDDVVKEFADTGRAFDLAGGNDPSLARFYAGFGAEPVFYLRALINRLPPVLRLLKP